MKVVGVIDIGTNSARLAVVHVASNHDSTILAQHKESIRLGEGEFSRNRITPAAADRGILVLRKFAEMARQYGASEVVAVATAAVREAQNRAEFVERARLEAGVELRVISGLEEARLIYLGVVSGVDLNSQKALFVDIGGGTTEMIVGDATDHFALESLKLGAIRLTEMFHSSKSGPISKKTYRAMLDYAHGAGSQAFRKMRAEGFDVAYGSSGTIMNLAEITAKRVGANVSSIRNYVLTYDDLRDTASMLCSLDLEKRRNVPGINPERADIIVSGAAILDSVMSGTGAQSIKISDRALRDGVLIDHVFQEDRLRDEYLSGSPRRRSILQLGRSCRFEERHSAKVTELALALFDQTREMGFHNLAEEERELLRYAAMVHDVGTFISIADHHKHSYYLISNWGLLGFDDREVEIIATVALCHRKMTPKKVRSPRLGPDDISLIQILSALLRIADGLDRSQLSLVNEAICRRGDGKNRLVLEVYATEDVPLEMWSLETKKSLFEETFGVRLDTKLITAPTRTAIR